MTLPDDREIRALHEAFAPSPAAVDLVRTHCQVVADLAQDLLSSRALTVDPHLVRVGSLLHDVGVYRLFLPGGDDIDHREYVRHGILGHEMLRQAGLPEAVCRFCSCHTGVGLTAADVVQQNLPLPVRDHLPRTVEEELVMYADCFHSKTRPPAFVLFGTRVDQLPDSYLRYLVNGIRKELDFGAVPVRLNVRASRNPFDKER